MSLKSTTIRKQLRPLVNLALILGLLAMLAVFVLATSNLSGYLYSASQEEYLAYNAARSIYQGAPSWNKVVLQGPPLGQGQDSPARVVEPAAFSDWKSKVEATLDARYEEQAGVSVTSYDLAFAAEYQLVYSGPAPTSTLEMVFPFPANLETLHDVQFLVDGAEPAEAAYSTEGIRWNSTLAAGRRYHVAISYKADGVNSFGYALDRDRRSDVDVVLHVRGVSGTSVTRDSLPTSSLEAGEDDERLAWQYAGLIPSRNIRIELPRRLSFAQRVEQLEDQFTRLAGLAPFLVGLFLGTLALLLRLSGAQLRLEAYLLVGLCLAAFYPALTFLSGLVYLYAAAALVLGGVSALVLVFLGLSAGWRRTLLPAAWLLFIFLGVFSLGQFLPWRGLVFTVGGLLLVATFMGVYVAHTRRAAQSAPPAGDAPDAGLPAEGGAPAAEVAVEPISAPLLVEAAPVSAAPMAEPVPVEAGPAPVSLAPVLHCPRCGCALGADFHFCAACGYDVQVLRTCPGCGQVQLLQAGLEQPHCVYCGEGLRV